MNKTKSADSRVMKNAAVLFAAMAVTKIVGAFLKIPLTNILGGLGMGYFSTAYSLFSPVYAVTAAALPTVVMRLTARHSASGNWRNVRRIRKAGLIAAFGLGLAGTAVIMIVAAPFSRNIAGSPNSLPSMLIIAPSLFFASISAIYRGYYEGLSNMFPTAISQIVEAVVKSTVGIVLAVMFMPRGIEYAAAGAIAGITIAELFGLAFLILRSKGRDGISPEDLRDSPLPQRKRVIIKTILTESAPITLAALAMNLNPFIDLLTVPNIINTLKLGHDGNFFYGSYTGIAVPVFAITTSITAMLGRSAFSEITSAWEKSDTERLSRTLRLLFKGTFVVGLPISLGLAAVSEPFLSLLYFSKPAEVAISTLPLTVLGLGGISLILSGTLFGIFLAVGRVDLQIKLMLLGSGLKAVFNVILIRIPDLNVTGAAVSTVICYTVTAIIGLFMLKRLVKANLGLTRFILQPLTHSLLCAATAYLCHEYAFCDRPPVLNLAMSVAAGGLVYLSLTAIAERRYLRKLTAKAK
ncbi:MAG: polysaccharide biosynthesis C-terminal domain-containing protein [Oscillospiraceae bacterium]|nr:polysaccharide biosynthesis C-terminal domain-containing protein [Oscillospiraceae bacterium]